jgi:hypothetical protein
MTNTNPIKKLENTGNITSNDSSAIKKQADILINFTKISQCKDTEKIAKSAEKIHKKFYDLLMKIGKSPEIKGSKGLNFESLRNSHECSIRLDDRYRLHLQVDDKNENILYFNKISNHYQ